MYVFEVKMQQSQREPIKTLHVKCDPLIYHDCCLEATPVNGCEGK